MLSLLTGLGNPFVTPTRREIAHWAKRNRFSKYLPYMAFDPEEKLYHNKDDTVGFLFRCLPIICADQKIEQNLAGLLELLPARGVLSVTLLSSPHLTPYLQRFKDLKVRARENSLLRAAVEKYATFLAAGAEGLPHLLDVPLRAFEVIVSVKVPKGEAASANVSELRTAFKEALNGCYMYPVDLSPDTLVRTLFLLLNGHLDENVRWDPLKPLSDQMILAESPVRVHYDHLEIGGNRFSCITPKQVAREVSANVLGKIIGGDKGPIDDSNQVTSHFLFTTVFTFDPNVANTVRTKASFFKKQAEGEDSILRRTIGEYASEHLWAVDELEKGTRFVYSMPLLWTWGASKERVKSAGERVKRLMGSQGFVPQEEAGILIPLLLSALPFGFYNEKGNLEVLDRYFLAPQRATAGLMPVVADYQGGGDPHVIFVSRKGQIVPFDPFDETARNKNICVMGTTGGGKSFTLNLYSMSMFASGAFVRIFDLGYSYQKLCRLLDGRYIDAGETRITLNPFSFIPAADDQETAHYLSALAALIGVMAYSETEVSPNETEANLIKAAVLAAWREFGTEAGVDEVYQYLARFPEGAEEDVESLCTDRSRCVENLAEAAQGLAFNLTQWTSRGTFGTWFNGRANVDLVSSPFIVFELERLQRVKALFRVASLAVMNATTAVLYLLPRDVPKVMIFEECGVTLKGNDLFKKVVEEAYRRGRKNNVSTATVFQSPLDLKALGPVGQVILGNAEFHLYLPSDDYRQAIRDRILPLEGYEHLLHSIESARPRYSEVGIKTPYGVGVVRTVVDSFLYWLCTSDPKDWTLIKKRTDQHGGDMITAIEGLARERDADLFSRFSAG